MSTKTNILFLGATGYLGGPVLSRLLNHPSKDTIDITVLVRSPEVAKKLETFGVKATVGSIYDNHDTVEKLAEQADVVFSIADADDLGWVNALLKGLRKRHSHTKTAPIVIHSSGTGGTAEPVGDKPAQLYNDNDVEQMKAIPPTAFHRNVDLAFLDADGEGYIRSYIVSPATVSGLASGLYDESIVNRTSIQIPGVIRASLDRKQAGIVPPGTGAWSNLHVDDTADLFVVVFDAIRKDPEVGHGYAGYYFAENGELAWSEISKAIGQAIVDLGIGSSAEVTPFTAEEMTKYWGSDQLAGGILGTNCRCRADRSRSIGWQPKKTHADLLAAIKPQVELLWNKGNVDLTPNFKILGIVQRLSASAAAQ